MIECLIAAEKECTEHLDVNPDKVLRPIGAVFRQWIEPISSTELPHWINWRVKAHGQTFRGRRGDTLLYERHEEVESFDP